MVFLQDQLSIALTTWALARLDSWQLVTDFNRFTIELDHPGIYESLSFVKQQGRRERAMILEVAKLDVKPG